jgi:hypothetical protein
VTARWQNPIVPIIINYCINRLVIVCLLSCNIHSHLFNTYYIAIYAAMYLCNIYLTLKRVCCVLATVFSEFDNGERVLPWRGGKAGRGQRGGRGRGKNQRWDSNPTYNNPRHPPRAPSPDQLEIERQYASTQNFLDAVVSNVRQQQTIPMPSPSLPSPTTLVSALGKQFFLTLNLLEGATTAKDPKLVPSSPGSGNLLEYNLTG